MEERLKGDGVRGTGSRGGCVCGAAVGRGRLRHENTNNPAPERAPHHQIHKAEHEKHSQALRGKKGL